MVGAGVKLLPKRGINAREPPKMEADIVGSIRNQNITRMNKILVLAFSLVVTMALPSYGQSKKELKAQIEKLQTQLVQTQKFNDALLTQNEDLRKRIETIRKCIIETTSDIPAAVSRDNATTQSCSVVSHTDNSPTSKVASTSASTSSYSPRKTSSYSGSSYSSSSGRTIYTGPRGGRYYINSKGNKVYIKR